MAQTETEIVQGIGSDYLTKYGFANPDEAKDYFFKSGRGLSHELVDAISTHKNEPDWMRKFRHQSLDYFLARPLPAWGGDLSTVDFDNIYYYIRPTEQQANSWEDLPADIKDTWDRLGIPEAEKKYLGGVGAQYESEVVYHKLQADLESKGVVFLDMDSGLREHEDLVKEYFGTIIPNNDNKFAALNSAVWSGGSFIYVPKGVRVELPLQAYFRINAENMGQFERTLILVDEDAYVHYVAGWGQHQDAGGKVVHLHPNTTSVITSKSISKNGGRAGYRGLLQVAKGAKNSKSKVVCDALILDEDSRSDTYPYIQIDENEVDIGHEATVSKIGDEQLFYLMSRGLSESEASAMVVSGFIEPIVKELPLEYAVEMNRLIQLQMEGSVG